MNEGDIYHWCDVGCHLNKNGIPRLREYIEIVKKDNNGKIYEINLKGLFSRHPSRFSIIWR